MLPRTFDLGRGSEPGARLGARKGRISHSKSDDLQHGGRGPLTKEDMAADARSLYADAARRSSSSQGRHGDLEGGRRKTGEGMERLLSFLESRRSAARTVDTPRITSYRHKR